MKPIKMTEAPTSYSEKRPWGSFERFTLNEPSTVKLITVNPDEAFSLQKHKGRDEWWKIIEGDGTATIGAEKKAIAVGDEYFIPKDTLHQIEAGKTSVVILEVSFGSFDENDIVRINDRYGRI
ncbi:MAG: phosphomannose isomerase type II C-terminal cupin domain [Candidatus Pacebacteria bacterium]|nr:phosphomannose isomerase type II C-terminal cupin domain [Candidatus Paceibacterota bacterium]